MRRQRRVIRTWSWITLFEDIAFVAAMGAVMIGTPVIVAMLIGRL